MGITAGEAVFTTVVIGGVAAWLAISVRWALRIRTVPDRTPEAYLAHYRAVGSTVVFVAVVLALASGLLGARQSAVLWAGPLAAVAVVVLGERHWPGPAGAIRTAVVGPPRRVSALLPWLPTISAVVGIGLAAVTFARSGLSGAVGSAAFAGLALVVTGAVVGGRVVYTRPALPGVTPAVDAAFRRGAAGRLVRLVALGALVMSVAFLSVPDPAGRAAEWLTWLCWGLIVTTIWRGPRPHRRDVGVPTRQSLPVPVPRP